MITPLLKFLNSQHADYVMRELHEGIYSLHTRGRPLATKVVCAGYYWSTLRADALDFTKRSDDGKSLQTFYALFLTISTI